jgi:hypothetical protein
MKRVFKTRHFNRLMKSLDDSALCDAVEEMVQGLIDADLGGYIVKKRVALPGRRKSGGARTIVATNKGNRWFFVFGFAKNEKANISAKELTALKDMAGFLLGRSDSELNEAVVEEELVEICHEQDCENCKT